MTSNRSGILPSSEIRFFKIIVHTTIQIGKLMIPKEFTRKHGASLSNPMFLKLPDGIEWEFSWTKEGAHNVWLEKGWKEFVTYYSLGHGHLLVFKYQQTCKLEVNIFDESGVEINYPSNNTQNHSAENLFEVSPTIPSYPGTSKKQRSRIGVVGESSNLPQQVCQENSSGAISSETPSFMVVMKESYVNGYLLVIPSIFAKKYLKKEGIHDVLLRVLDGRTWHVSLKDGKFRKGWKDFASDNRLNIGDICTFDLTESQACTNCVSRRYLRTSEVVMLQFGNKTWEIGLGGAIQTKMSNGWSQFAKECKVRHGDVCVFELINIKDAVLDVHIFRGQS
ncbi:hypothetical protein ACSQ67_013795 [Phaseolus vulgaris]